MNTNINQQDIQDQVSLEEIKEKHKTTWEDGNYAQFAKYMEAGAIEILHEWDFATGQSLLDVGCGSGQIAIPAAKKGLKVTGVDIAENLLEHARQRASEAKLNVNFRVGDAENLPLAANHFDIAVSMFGAMFAPRPEKVVQEFARVLKSGGKLVMTNWTPNSMPAQMFRSVAAIVPPPPGSVSPVLWGDEAVVYDRLSEEFTDISLTRKNYPQWHYPFNASELVNFFRSHFGPVKRAFEVVSSREQIQLHHRLRDIYSSHSEYYNDVLTITGGEYLEVIATCR